jgi:DNA invertase Pin-like site-specific DNA recombinase
MIVESKPNIYGYARVSKDEQTTSIKVQADYIGKLCEELTVKHNGEWSGVCHGEVTSARTTRYYEREVFSSLMRMMKKGDHLVVYKLDRLERKQRYAIELGYKLLDMGVTLHVVVGIGGQQISLDNHIGQLIFSIGAWFAECEVETLRERTKSALGYRKLNGYAVSRAPLGYETKPIAAKTEGGKPFKIHVPNKIDLQNIFRIVYLIDRCGWTMTQVACALNKEGVRTSKGTLWAPIYKCRKKHHKNAKPELCKIRMVYRKYKQNPESFFDTKLFTRLMALSEIEVAGETVKAVGGDINDPTEPFGVCETAASCQSPTLALLPTD